MRKITLFCAVIIVLMASVAALGYTNARYYSSVSMSGEFDYVRTIGGISLYNPTWIGGYNAETGVFEILYKGAEFSNIYYEVQDKSDNATNEKDVSYYIRVVAEDGSSTLPITYEVYDYSDNNVGRPESKRLCEFDANIGGYGPFILQGTKYFSIGAASESVSHFIDCQNLWVQMVEVRKSGNLNVISEAPLKIQFAGCKLNLNCINSLDNSVVQQNTLHIRVGTTITFEGGAICFNSPGSVKPNDISLPGDYEISGVECDFAEVVSGTDYRVTLPAGEGSAGATYDINVILRKNDVPMVVNPDVSDVPVKFYDLNGVEVGAVTITMKDGKYTFTTENCREFCSNLAGMTSFTIYIASQWGPGERVGNTYEDESVELDYYDPNIGLNADGAYIYIKADW